MASQLEYSIKVILSYRDGRTETITVKQKASDEETARNAVWHEYKNLLGLKHSVSVSTRLLGLSLPTMEMPPQTQGPRSWHHVPKSPLSDLS